MNEATGPRSCLTCGADISARRSDARHCGPACYERWKRPPLKLSLSPRGCLQCGAEFTPGNVRALCCSRSCTVARNNQIQNAKTAVSYTPTPCPVCGRSFTPVRSDNLTCSPSCRERRRYVPKRHQRMCVGCGESFVATRSDAETCSTRCAGRLWHARHPGVRRLRAAQYGAKRYRLESLGAGISASDWQRTLQRWGGACAYCGQRPVQIQMDHVVPLARGGAHSIGNILPACPPCNMSKGAKLLTEWRARRSRRRSA